MKQHFLQMMGQLHNFFAMVTGPITSISYSSRAPCQWSLNHPQKETSPTFPVSQVCLSAALPAGWTLHSCCSRVSSSGAASVSFCSWPDPFHRPWTWFTTLPHLGLWVNLITRTWPCPQCSNPAGLCPVGEEPAPGADSSCSSLAESSSVECCITMCHGLKTTALYHLDEVA